MAFKFNSQEKEGTLIVDALNLAFRWKHQGRTDFRYEYQETVKSLANSYKCKNVIITADEGSSSYRRNILPDYKQNRKEKYADQTQAEKIAFEVGHHTSKIKKNFREKIGFKIFFGTVIVTVHFLLLEYNSRVKGIR